MLGMSRINSSLFCLADKTASIYYCNPKTDVLLCVWILEINLKDLLQIWAKWAIKKKNPYGSQIYNPLGMQNNMQQCTDIIQHQSQEEIEKTFHIKIVATRWCCDFTSQLHTCAAAYLMVEVNILPQFSM